MNRAIPMAALVCLLLAACLQGRAQPKTNGTTPPSATATYPPLAVETLKNATYHSTSLPGNFQLVNGLYQLPPLPEESQDDYFIRLVDPIAFGDLNSDGLPDAAVILKSRAGGTGVFSDLAAVLNQNGKPLNIATVDLGDRVLINAAVIQAGEIVLDMMIHGPNEGLCCASLRATWKFKLSDGDLVQQPGP